MSNKNQFVDGIGQIAVLNGLARIELTTFEDLSAEPTKQTQVVDSRLVMPIDALLRLHQACQKVVEQLETKGVIKKREVESKKSATTKQ